MRLSKCYDLFPLLALFSKVRVVFFFRERFWSLKLPEHYAFSVLFHFLCQLQHILAGKEKARGKPECLGNGGPSSVSTVAVCGLHLYHFHTNKMEAIGVDVGRSGWHKEWGT